MHLILPQECFVLKLQKKHVTLLSICAGGRYSFLSTITSMIKCFIIDSVSKSLSQSIWNIFMLEHSDTQICNNPFNHLHSFIHTWTSALYYFNMWLKFKRLFDSRGGKKQFQPVKSSLCVPRPEKDITHYSPAPSHTHTHTRYDECVTCSFVSHCRSGSGRRARRPGVRPSLSAPRVARTASGWSAGKHTRSPTSAPPSGSQSPATTREKKQAMSRKKRELSPIFSREMIHCYRSFFPEW